MISDNELKEWVLDFEYETGYEVDPVTLKSDEQLGYPQVKFCIWKFPERCFVIMRDETEAKQLAMERVIENYDYDQDCPMDDDWEMEGYAREKAEHEWCKVLSGEDFGCDELSAGQVFWEVP